jgi:hypothetical protein
MLLLILCLFTSFSPLDSINLITIDKGFPPKSFVKFVQSKSNKEINNCDSF